MLEKTAIISQCGAYRYLLGRIWKRKKGLVCFVGLNPSTADANIDDPTIRRCIRYVDFWGYGGLLMANIFGYRSTNPKKLLEIDDPIGPKNMDYLFKANTESKITITAWGKIGSEMIDQNYYIQMLKNPHYLDLTKDGYPRHPLYLKKDLRPIPWATQ